MTAFLCFILGAALAALGAWRMPPCWEPPDRELVVALTMVVVGVFVAGIGVLLGTLQ